MKKLFFIAAIIIYGAAFGQESSKKLVIEKGTFNIGGKASFSFSNYENEDDIPKDKYSEFGITPNFGYALKNNLIIGLGVGYSYGESENYRINNSIVHRYDATFNRFSIFPYIKKYFPLGNKLTLFLQGEVNYSENKTKRSNSEFLNNNDDSRNTFFAGFRPGITYFLSKKLALEANLGSLGYNKAKHNYGSNNSNKSESFNFNLNSSNLQFGVSYFF
ncbi:outer membrane beta-barrel protein [Flavivirga abyssicola]|uniref:outer membrane protein n=1 Tax=Flavivirga abyssicola TaxID=3063533 RepID=UPI0026DF6188|nr:outer membrane beta-barrel protein [Flavivirga sp. MEBiC07777]WVK13329.1 outer membrane beta-barrel protein [Flavivirga sp. MEBiC07777]